MNNVVMSKDEMGGRLTPEDLKTLDALNGMYLKSLSASEEIAKAASNEQREDAARTLAENSKRIGDYLEAFVKKVPNMHVYCFDMPSSEHPIASRIISKLRNAETQREEFTYYIQRAYELMFTYVFCQRDLDRKRSIICRTPVSDPGIQYACHRIIDIDDKIDRSVVCVMLRGALLPSMIISKEIEEYSSGGYVTPFALFRIKREEGESARGMRYVMDLDRSFFYKDELEGKDLIFADPMNATGGSLITILKFLESNSIKIRSVKFINIISALEGCLNIARLSCPFPIGIYTLWLDPVLNSKAYILPGLGDAGDRINGSDSALRSRNILQLIADYGSLTANLYRNQLREIERVVLEKR